MSMFSTHNVKQVIVANSIDATGVAVGAFVKVLAEPGNTGFYIMYTNASGQTVKSDKISFDKIKYFRTKMVDKSLGNDVQFRTFNRLLFFNFNLAFAFKYTNENSYTSTYEKISNDELSQRGFQRKS